jgi:hypothetical protein
MVPQASDETEAEEDPEVPEVFDSVAPAPSAADLERASISHLMQRLELGLLRREGQGWNIPVGETQQNNEPSPKLDQRLRSAIDDLSGSPPAAADHRSSTVSASRLIRTLFPPSSRSSETSAISAMIWP